MQGAAAEVLAPNVYFDRQFQCDAAKILPGEYYVTTRHMVLVTVLGSCVAACIRDREQRIGGMNHFMLPGEDTTERSIASAAGRYGAYAMEVLINHLLKLGAKRRNLEAKLFGGGNVLRELTVGNIGQRNADFALEYLAREQIPVVAQDLIDIYPRKIYYFPDNGKVLVRKLRSTHNTTIVTRESEYRTRLRGVVAEDDVELFT